MNRVKNSMNSKPSRTTTSTPSTYPHSYAPPHSTSTSSSSSYPYPSANSSHYVNPYATGARVSGYKINKTAYPYKSSYQNSYHHQYPPVPQPQYYPSKHNVTYYPPKPPVPATATATATTTATTTATPVATIPTSTTSSLTPGLSTTPVTTAGTPIGNDTVVLNGAKYTSKNGKLIRVPDSSVGTITEPQKPVSITPNPTPSYLKTKTGSIVRVTQNTQKITTNTTANMIPSSSKYPLPTSSTGITKPVSKTSTGRAKVNNKDILLNPRIMPYCPQFTLTGKCTKGHRCQYARHDSAHLALCKQFLMRNGVCSRGTRCSLSHTPTDYNLPTCTYYLDGECSSLYGHGHKEQNPYLDPSKITTAADKKKIRKSKGKEECKFAHPPKLAPGTSENADRKLCREFAYTGYCTLGSQKCPYVHSYQCPDFTESGSCNIRNCKLMHVNSGAGDSTPKNTELKNLAKNSDKDSIKSATKTIQQDSSAITPSTTTSSSVIDSVALAKRLYDIDDYDDSDDDDDDSESEKEAQKKLQEQRALYKKRQPVILESDDMMDELLTTTADGTNKGENSDMDTSESDVNDDDEDDDEEEEEEDREFINFWQRRSSGVGQQPTSGSSTNSSNSDNDDDDDDDNNDKEGKENSTFTTNKNNKSKEHSSNNDNIDDDFSHDKDFITL